MDFRDVTVRQAQLMQDNFLVATYYEREEVFGYALGYFEDRRGQRKYITILNSGLIFESREQAEGDAGTLVKRVQAMDIDLLSGGWDVTSLAS